ncbi:MAG: sigma-70 family RNA polymerase sigma factor [Cyanobacteria bacterium J06650_10]
MTLEEKLKNLAMEAQKAPLKTPQRQRALTQLVDEIYRSNRLVRPYKGQFQGFYEDIYAEAQQRLFLHICEQINQYNPKFEVLQWTNFLMKRRFFVEASRDVMPSAPKGMDRTNVKRITLDVLDKQEPLELRSQSTISLSEEVIQCIREDRDGLFRDAHIQQKPEATFQYIALQFLGGYSWKEISAELDVKVVTLSSFYQRCLVKFAPILKAYVVI